MKTTPPTLPSREAKPPWFLAIETSTAVGSVALHQGARLVGGLVSHQAASHSRQLGLMTQQLLTLYNLSVADLSAVCVSQGPGSYTGLRIGVTMAKGLCYAHDLPLLAVDTLDTVIPQGQVEATGAPWVVLIDARRGYAYARVVGPDGLTCLPTQGLQVKASSFERWLTQGLVYFVGNGAEQYAQALAHPHAVVLPGYHPNAAYMGAAAQRAFLHRAYRPLATFSPYYLRAFPLT